MPWLCSEDHYCPWEKNWLGCYQVAPTGCVATAAGQVMKYWEWPITGEGSHTWDPPYDACCENTYGPYTVDYAAQTYNWAIMPYEVVPVACAWSSAGDKEVAKLLRHVGNAVDMDYKPGGSSAGTWYLATVLPRYFKYDYSAHYEDRDSTSYDDWAVKLREELDAGRPIVYRGGGSEVGHAFVCDGYGILDLFHFNWGWDGLLNGWYWLSALTTLNGNFTADQGGIFELKPDYPPIAETDAYTVNENNTLNVGTPGVLGNDSNPLGGPITAVKYTNPSNGTLTLNSNGSFTYKPKTDFYGTDSFYYRANDGRYNSDTTKVTITVNAVNDPPVAEAGGPYTGIEGSPVAFTGSGTDIDGDALKYRWDFEKDGTWDTGWSDSGTASQTWDDDWTGTAMVQVSDGELTAEDTASVTIENVAPTCVAGPDQSQYWGLPVNFDGTVSDPSMADTEFGLQPTWIFGDGDTAAGLSLTHIYADPGLYTAELTATDKDGGVGSDTAQVGVNKREAILSYTGDTTAVFGYATLSAQLSDAVDTATAQLNGRTVLFTIDGSTITATTNSQGIATASPIPIIPGDYQVDVAFAEGSHYLASSAQGTLSVTISAGKVTAGVTEVASKGRGGFNVQSDGTTVKGELQFKDDMDKYHASEMTALGIALDGKSAWLVGVGKDGRQFIAYVEDNDEPRSNDVFKLWIEGTLHNSDGTLEGGNIQIHK
ncbi:MAG: C10 family peptidase [Dehalococcoidia bacterium]|nr:C10 family peptidase [Dehalococcoidia bacterium]